MAEDQTPITEEPSEPTSPSIFNLSNEEIVALVDSKAGEYLASPYAGLIQAESDLDLFNIFAALEFLTRTDEGKALAESFTKEVVRYQEAVIAEVEDRSGLQYGGPEIIGL